MNFPSALLQHPAVPAMGWTLIHSLWQGALVALLLGGALLLLRRADARWRYVASCGALGLMLLLPCATLSHFLRQPNAGIAANHYVLEEDHGTLLPRAEHAEANAVPPTPIVPAAVASMATHPPSVVPAEAPLSLRLQLERWRRTGAAGIEPLLPWAVGVWLGGVVLMSLFHAGGWVRLQRLRRRGTVSPGTGIEALVGTLARRMGLRRPVRVLSSALVHVPGVIGCVRPIILLPAACLTGLPARDLEAILAHELAHVLRRDYLANLLQSAAEVVLFYHPAVWWISARIRAEREFCCDDLAVAAMEGDVAGYSRALVTLAERAKRHSLPAPAVAATGGHLLRRVRRLLSLAVSDPAASPRWGARAAVLLPLLVLVALSQAPVLGGDGDGAKGEGNKEKDKPSAASAKTPPPPSVQVAIAGSVRLPDGQPATSATVELFSGEPAGTATLLDSTTSTLTGGYRVAAPAAGQYLLRVSAPGYPSYSSLMPGYHVGPDRGAEKGTRVLRRDATLTTRSELRGLVTDSDNRPVTDALVRASATFVTESGPWATDESTVTDSLGRYALSNVPGGALTVLVTSASHAPLMTTAIAPATSSTIRLRDKGAVVEGAVLSFPDGTPLSSATITLAPAGDPGKPQPLFPESKVVTDASGIFRFERLAPASYQLHAERDGLFSQKGPIRFDVSEGETTGPVMVHLYSGHSVTGRVLEWGTRKPIEGVQVKFGTDGTSAAVSARSDAEGRFRLNPVVRHAFGATTSGGGVVLKADKEGYRVESNHHDRSVIVQLPENGTEAVAEIEMRVIPMVSGTVRTPDGSPVAGAVVARVGHSAAGRPDYPSPTASADEQGNYILPADRGMSLRVQAEAPGYSRSTSELVLIDTESTNGVDIILERGGSISGEVVDVAGSSVSGVEVELMQHLEVSRGSNSVLIGRRLSAVLSDGSGRFTAENVPSGEITVGLTSRQGMSSASLKLVIKDGESTSGIVLVAGSSGHFVEGRVVDTKGSPLRNIEVLLAPAKADGPYTRTSNLTGEEGRYSFKGLTDRPVRITATLSRPTGNVTASRLVEKLDQRDVDIVLDTPAEIPPLEFAGRVIDAKTGRAVEDFSVQTEHPAHVVRKEPAKVGMFFVSGVKPGYSFSVKIEAPGYAPHRENPPLAHGRSRIDHTFRLGEGGTISGTVIDRKTGQPRAGVIVEITGRTNTFDPPEAKTATTADGRFELAGVAEGSVTVRFRDPALFAASDNNRWSMTTDDHGRTRTKLGSEDAGVVATERVTLSHGKKSDMGEILIGGGATLRGVVLSGDKPVPQAKVELNRFGGGDVGDTLTDDAGRFEFRDLMATNYHIYLGGALNALNSNVQMSDGKDREIVLRVGSATIKGRLLQRGIPVSGVVNLSLREGVGADATMSYIRHPEGDGTFSFSGLSAGTWEVSAYRQGGRIISPVKENVVLKEGETVERDLELPSGRVAGVVVDADDKPVPGARVSLTRSPDASAQDLFSNAAPMETTTDANGEFSFLGLTGGTWSLMAAHDKMGFSSPLPLEVSASADAPPQRLRLSGSDAGTIISVALGMADGQPIRQAWCKIYGEDGEIPHGAVRAADGTMEITGIPPGRYRTSTSYWGYSVSEQTVIVEAGKTSRIEDVLYLAGSMEWTITDASGNPVAGAACRVVPNDTGSIEEVRTGVTDAKGQFTARGFGPGQYTATARLAAGGEVTQLFEIREKGHTVHTSQAN